MYLNELVVQALGEERARRLEDGTLTMLSRADATPQFSESVTHLLIRLSSRDPAGANRELDDLLNRDPRLEWSYVTYCNPDGSRVARASPYVRQMAALGSMDWALAFMFSDLFMRLSAWWLTQTWRAAELAVGARDALNEWSVLIAAACARSLLEGAAYLAAEAQALVDLWDEFKRIGIPTVETLNDFSQNLNRQLVAFQYASRIGQAQGRPPQFPSTNVMTYVTKLAKRRPDAPVLDIYEWLCDAVHPSFGSVTTYLATRLIDTPRSHLIERYARHPLDRIVSDAPRLEPTVAQKAADAVVLASDTLDQELRRTRWVIDDLALTTDIAASLRLDVPLAHPRPERNSRCPCGSGRKFKRCVHRWGQPGVMPD